MSTSTSTTPVILDFDQRVEALFASNLQFCQGSSSEAVREAVRDAVSRFEVAGCAAIMAGAYGDHPEASVERLRWACDVVRNVFYADA